MPPFDPRDKTQIVFFQPNHLGSLIGHLKYLYLTLLEDPVLRELVLLVTANLEEYKSLIANEYPVAFWSSQDGHQHTWNAIAKSKIVFIDDLEHQLPLHLRLLVGEGKFINLWHGKDGKETGFKYLESCPQFEHYISVLNSIRCKTRMLSPGNGEHNLALKTAFPGAELFNAPDIRTWGILDPRFEQSIGVDQAALAKIKKYSNKSKALWCPTFRDIQIPNAYEEISLNLLDEFCGQTDIHFFIKPHRYDKRLTALESTFNNIHFISSTSDIYPLVKYFQTTITDYSSIAVDFMENQIPTVLFQFDLEKYTTWRKIRPLPNSIDIKKIFSQIELEAILAEDLESFMMVPTPRDFEVEKEIWVEMIKKLLYLPD